MTIDPDDLTGGLAPGTDEVTAFTPEEPSYREGGSLWIWDDAGRVGIPRVGVEAVGATWDTARFLSLNLTFPDGRTYVGWGDHPPPPVTDEQGRPRVLGVGPLSLVCVEPFRHWRLIYEGTVAPTSPADQIAGTTPRGPALTAAATVPLRIEVDCRMAAPPWVQGTHAFDGNLIPGEDRFEQLFTAAGVVDLDGTTTTFDGGGLRIHRKGGNRSDYNVFHGHSWQSALFGSGRAFGYIHYKSGPDGEARYHEGWVRDGGRILPAKVVETPWLNGMRPTSEDVSFTLRTPEGDIPIKAETTQSTFAPLRELPDGKTFPDLQQGIARYHWGDETAYGMIERSTR